MNESSLPADISSETFRAFHRARTEADAWATVYETIRTTAVIEARDAGLSYSQIADLLDLSKATVTRTLAKDAFGTKRLHTWSMNSADPTRERFDDTWIEAGAPRVASPDAQFRHGLISAEERDQLNEQMAQAQKPIPQQLQDAVTDHPGLTAPELLPFMMVAVANAETVSFAHHADAAQVLIDGQNRYWPTTRADHLRPGYRVPRHQGALTSSDGEWVTIDQVSDAVDGHIPTIYFSLDDGLSTQWYNVPSDVLHAVDTTGITAREAEA